MKTPQQMSYLIVKDHMLSPRQGCVVFYSMLYWRFQPWTSGKNLNEKHPYMMDDMIFYKEKSPVIQMLLPKKRNAIEINKGVQQD